MARIAYPKQLASAAKVLTPAAAAAAAAGRAAPCSWVRLDRGEFGAEPSNDDYECQALSQVRERAGGSWGGAARRSGAEKAKRGLRSGPR